MLLLHRAERADRLADGLAEVLRNGPSDPFTADVVAVPARGVERWLAQRLSNVLGAEPGRADGVCANIAFPSTGALVEQALAAGSGVDPAADPWHRARLVWPLLEVLEDSTEESWCPSAASQADQPGGRFIAAAHLGALYSSYADYRPAMLQAWARGDDLDGAGAVLDGDLAWQAALWRLLRDRIGTASPAERLATACCALRERPESADLPGRVSLFGPTRLTTQQRAVVAALAERRDVHLWLPHPSPALWERVRRDTAACGAGRRQADPTAVLPAHPLLSSLGRDARELQVLLASDAEALDRHHPAPPGEPVSLLGQLQHDLRIDRAPEEHPVGDRDDCPLLAASDRSVQVHACHGPARQVEVLREVLLGLLAADPSLEPRDVLVMCPDIESFAPLISAAFGLGEERGAAEHPGHRLRVRLADRSLRQTNPLLAVLAQLLDLADARVTASQVLDLAASAPVRRRFRFDDDDLEQVRDWVARAGVRWGLDALHRAPYHLDRVPQNTWQAGLDRILLGVAMAEDDNRWLGLALPMDDVDSSDIDLAGRLAEMLDRLRHALGSLGDVQCLTAWVTALSSALTALTSVTEADQWQRSQADAELAEVAADAGNQADDVRLSLADVRAVLARRLRGRPTRANFRTGALTMCSMVPMRSVPHRVVCLLGLDDGRFPRDVTEDGDDILARDPCVGERDRRSEDRQLLLDAICAARDHLVVVYTGADDRTNTPRTPAVPIGEILDAIDLTVRTEDGTPPREQIVVRHPLQPFDARNFAAGALGVPGPFSFDRPSLEGARAAALPRDPTRPFLSVPLPSQEADSPAADNPVDLDDLIRFLEHPVRGFLRQRLGVTLPGEEEEVADALSVELDPLQRWAVGDRLLQARLAGGDPESCRQAEWRRGSLPPGALGSAVLDRVLADVEPLVSAAGTLRAAPLGSVEIAVALPDGRPLSGVVSGVSRDVLLRVVYSRLGPKHRLRAWTQLLALAATAPPRSWVAATVGRGSSTWPRRSTLAASSETAASVLADLVDLYDRGLREPLPLPLSTAYAYADARRAGRTVAEALVAAASAWDAGHAGAERADLHHQLVWGEQPVFEIMLQEPPLEQEQLDPALREPSRFGTLARRLWQPLLAAETLGPA